MRLEHVVGGVSAVAVGAALTMGAFQTGSGLGAAGLVLFYLAVAILVAEDGPEPAPVAVGEGE